MKKRKLRKLKYRAIYQIEMYCVCYLCCQLCFICHSNTSDTKMPSKEVIRVSTEVKKSAQIQGCASPKTRKTELRPCYLGPWLCKH